MIRHIGICCGLIGLFTQMTNGAIENENSRIGLSQDETAKRNVIVLIYEEVDVLDFSGPLAVFHATSRNGQQRGSDPFNVIIASPDGKPVSTCAGLKMVPTHSLDNCPKPDIIVIPGGGSRNLSRDKLFQEWLTEHAEDAEVILTVCTGVRAVAEMGMLDGKQATTHANVMAHYKRSFPKIEFLSNKRYVDNGKIVTSGGVSAGIDGAFHVVSRLLGEREARMTARRIEYNWQPQDQD